ncbi:tripartite tricarboxylate transporter TctB family protein [Salipiger thiooxidans]|uniref:tripartite tricarboxylate transporter TctB family protein n=1 Tax=Salipiger thiooxidans TaxID=282683 RepID=UPI00299D98AA|nr:tripartite tricarboxylate transporter TctB family protein [Salipiger thiooxidans]
MSASWVCPNPPTPPPTIAGCPGSAAFTIRRFRPATRRSRWDRPEHDHARNDLTRRTFAPDAGGLISGAIMLAIGIAVIVTSLGHGIGSLLRMDAGFFPMLLGAGAILLGLAITLRHRLFPAHSDEADTPLPETIDWAERWHRLRPMLLVPLGIAAFAALLETAAC